MAVQVTQGMRTVRDFRSMLMDAAYSLNGSDQQTVLCLLFQSGFSSKRLRQELAQFQAVVKKDLARRIQVNALKSPADLRLALPPGMDALQARVAQALAGKPKTSTREAVVGQLLHRWINQLAPVTVAELAALSGASIPTVYAALTTLKGSSLQRNEACRWQGFPSVPGSNGSAEPRRALSPNSSTARVRPEARKSWRASWSNWDGRTWPSAGYSAPCTTSLA